jgi:hypothetical protein
MLPSTPLRSIAVVATAFALAACSDAPPADVDPTERTAAAEPLLGRGVVTEPATGPWARVVEGSTGPGALYALYVPRDWNGDAVCYAHGFRDAASPVDLRDQDGLYAARDQLGALGYAVAYSSFSRNGFAVKDGALLLCGMVGGSLVQTQYLGHVKALTDAFFPGAFPGTLAGVPDGTVITIPQVGAAVPANPTGSSRS